MSILYKLSNSSLSSVIPDLIGNLSRNGIAGRAGNDAPSVLTTPG
jgi:hypothetical protein